MRINNKKIKTTFQWLVDNKRKIFIVLGLALLISSFFIVKNPVFASEMERVLAEDDPFGKILSDHYQFFSLKTTLKDMGRSVLWFFLSGLYKVVYLIENMLTEVLGFYGFVEFMKTHSIYTSIISLLISALMAGTLVWIGVKILLNQGQVPQFKNVLQNTIVSGILIIGMPFLMDTLQEGVEIIYDVSTVNYKDTLPEDILQPDKTENFQTKGKLSTTILDDNFYDLYISFQKSEDLDSLNEYFESPQKLKHGIKSPDSIRYIKENEFFEIEEIPSDFASDDFEELLNQQINYYPSEDGNISEYVEEIKDLGWLASLMPGNILNTGYYRYSWNTLPIVIFLISLGIAILFVIFSMVSIYIEMAFQLIASPVVLATDLETGQKSKKVMQDIMTGFLTIAFEIIAFEIYIVFYTWLMNQNFNIVLQSAGIISATLALFRGSRTILTWFGVDLGLAEGQSGFGSLMRLAGLGMLLGGKASKVTRGMLDGKEEIAEKQKSIFDNFKEEGDTPIPPDADDKKESKFSELSEKFGYASTRGAKGLIKDGIEFVEDELTGKLDETSDAFKQVKDKLSDTTNEVVDAYEYGKFSGKLNRKIDQKERGDKDIQNSSTKDGQKDLKKSSIIGIQSIQDSLDEMDTSNTKDFIEQLTEEINETEGIDNATKEKMFKELNNIGSLEPEMAKDKMKKVLNKIETQGRATSKNLNVKDIGLPTEVLEPLTQSKNNLKLDRSEGIDYKINDLTKAVKKQAYSPKIIEDNLRQAFGESENILSKEMEMDIIQEVLEVNDASNIEGVSHEIIQKRIVEKIENELSHAQIPELKQTEIIKNVQKISTDYSNQVDTVINEIENSANASPTQLQRNIVRNIRNIHRDENIKIPTDLTQEIDSVIKDVDSLSIESLIEKVEGKIGGSDDFKEKVIKEIRNSKNVNEQQFQANLKKIRKKYKE